MKTPEPDTDPVTFPAPEGFSLPDGVNPGDTFQDTASFKQNDDGTLTLIEIDGLPVTNAPESDADEASEDEPPDDDDAAPPPAPAKKKKSKPMALADVIAGRFAKSRGSAKS